MRWLTEKIMWVLRSLADAVGIVLFAAFMLVALVGGMLWALMPWHRARVRAEAEKLRAKERAEELRKRLEEEKAKRDAEIAYREAAVKAKASTDLEADPVKVANELIRG